MNRWFRSKRDEVLESLLQLQHKRKMNAMRMENMAQLRQLKRDHDKLYSRFVALEGEVKQARVRLDTAGVRTESLLETLEEMDSLIERIFQSVTQAEDAENPEGFVHV